MDRNNLSFEYYAAFISFKMAMLNSKVIAEITLSARYINLMY